MNVVVPANSTAILDLTPNFILLGESPGGMLMRMVGQVGLGSDAITAGLRIWAAGVMVITEDAFSGAVAPDPLVDITQSWYYWIGFQQVLRTDTVAINPLFFPMDIRSMRRLTGNMRLVLVVKNSVGSAGSIRFSMFVRMLWKPL